MFDKWPHGALRRTRTLQRKFCLRLSSKKALAMRHVTDRKENVFTTGGPGTGKSAILNAIIMKCRKRRLENLHSVAVTAIWTSLVLLLRSKGADRPWKMADYGDPCHRRGFHDRRCIVHDAGRTCPRHSPKRRGFWRYPSHRVRRLLAADTVQHEKQSQEVGFPKLGVEQGLRQDRRLEGSF
ncbi:hypothetical protein K470DRAFT_255505 [Piedraia hortae CBS 480.64]|uniref:Uncharacterized protein n=1 Tax=Piedraia hortae CBS 480.64 TaxID=1314780 RepID=A0A6A7C6C3_9PEZI|nr:hypothetical protein K470DRAFT_255505 [Piedraia hortae CBS 480.64]